MGVGPERVGIRALLQKLLEEEFDCTIPAEKFHFSDHHMCHALGAYVHSGFSDGLVITLDGAPIEGATVSFSPEDSSGIGASGMTQSDGSFTLNAQAWACRCFHHYSGHEARYTNRYQSGLDQYLEARYILSGISLDLILF